MTRSPEPDRSLKFIRAAYAWLRGKRASQALMTPAEIEHVEQSQQA